MRVLQVEKSGDWLKHIAANPCVPIPTDSVRKQQNVLARMLEVSEKIYFSLFSACAVACDNEVQEESSVSLRT